MTAPFSKSARAFADRAQRPHGRAGDNLDQLRVTLRQRAADVAIELIGEPNRAMSSTRQLRFGRKGSVAVEIAGPDRGAWFDHESGEGGNLLDLIGRERRCAFGQAVKIAGELVAIEPKITPAGERSARIPSTDRLDNDRDQLIGRLWSETVPASGTLAETYLTGRRLALRVDAADIRFHPACPSGAERHPAMVAALRDIWTDQIVGLHRTFLDLEGRKLDRKMLGRARGAAIKLSPNETVEGGLFVSEGVETGLALLNFGLAPVWALGSAGAIRSLPVLDGIEALTIAVDHDPAGEAAAAECALRWRSAGSEVRLIRSPVAGQDIADLAGVA